MPTSTNVTNLKINTLTEAQYDTAVQGGVIGANELSILTDVDEAIQVDTIPTASADELGKVYQFIGTTDANYTHGYFYECVSDGGNPATYSWSRVDVQPGGLVNTATGTGALTIAGNSTDKNYAMNIGVDATASAVESMAIGYGASASARYSTAVGRYAIANGEQGTAIGNGTKASDHSTAIGGSAYSTGSYSIQLGCLAGSVAQNSETRTMKVALGGSNNYKLLDSDGTIPADRLVHAINKYSTMPTAASTNEGWIVQFTGTTDSTYTHGHLYECVSDGGNPATYSWTQIDVQPGGLVNTATGTDSLTIAGTANVYSYGINIGSMSSAGGDAVAIGYNASSNANGVAIGKNTDNKSYGGAIVIGSGSSASAGFNYGIVIGSDAKITASNCIQLNASGSTKTNSDANTFKVGNANGNYELMSADGTIPHARLTNAVQSTTVTIATTDWSSNTASVTVSGLTATSVVWVAPDNASQSAYTTAGVYASSQSADMLTFTCTQTPSASLTINVVFC